MTADASPDAARSTDEIVDVLIIGAGASGAAVAWSLAETRMKILCLEQGAWIKSSEFPRNGRDWEARLHRRRRHAPPPCHRRRCGGDGSQSWHPP
jgi:choline dehydrogenase-like flavoprotein